MEPTDFVSRILIIKEDEILFHKTRIDDSIYSEIYRFSKKEKINYPIEIWQEMYYGNKEYKILKLCTILGFPKKKNNYQDETYTTY